MSLNAKTRNVIGEILTPFIILGIGTAIYSGTHRHEKVEVLNEEKLVQAIYIQEGGSRTHYPFGIKSIPCSTKMECQVVCARTVRNNFKRFTQDGHKGIASFIHYLSSRYVCGNDGECPQRQSWEKNVMRLYGRS